MNSANPVFQAISQRRNAVKFSDCEVSDEVLEQLLTLADTAPSGFNLQPWHFIIVRNEELKHLMFHVTLEQKQILNAPATVVFVAKHRAWQKDYDNLLNLSLEKNALSPDRVKVYRAAVNRFFHTGPFEFYGFIKRVLLPLRKRRHPTPQLLCQKSEVAHYMRLQTMMAAATFMIAAEGAGLHTNPMQGFDEYRVKKLLNIPKHMSVPIIVALGYPAEEKTDGRSVRLPLSKKVSFDVYSPE